MRRVALLVAPLLALVLVAGCDSGSDKPDSTASAGESTANDKSGPCAVGTWVTDASAVFETMGLEDDDDVDMTTDGQMGLDLSKDGNIDATWDLTFQMSDSEREMQGAMDVTFTGTWSGSDSDLELTIGRGEGTMTRTVDGEVTTQDAGYLFDEEEVWTATCSASTMMVTMPGSDGDTKITYTRR